MQWGVNSPSPVPPLKFPVRIPRCATAGRFLRAANLSPRCSFQPPPFLMPLVVMHIIARGRNSCERKHPCYSGGRVVCFGGNCRRLRLIMRRVINRCVPSIDCAESGCLKMERVCLLWINSDRWGDAPNWALVDANYGKLSCAGLCWFENPC